MGTLLIAILLPTLLIIIFRKINYKRKSELQEHYLRVLILGDSRSERYIDEISPLASSRIKESTARVIIDLIPIIYRIEPLVLEQVSNRLNLSGFLLNKAYHSRGARRTLYLTMLAKCPITKLNGSQLSEIESNGSRIDKFMALLTRINTARKSAIALIATYPYTLSPFEIQQLIEMLRQGTLVVAYQPLLKSSHTNITLLGIAIVSHFGIDTAENELREIISQSANHTLRREALYALASMQLLLATPQIAQYVKTMPLLERQQLLRYITIEGYDENSIRLLSSKYEQGYYHSIINSYKTKLECGQLQS